MCACAIKGNLKIEFDVICTPDKLSLCIIHWLEALQSSFREQQGWSNPKFHHFYIFFSSCPTPTPYNNLCPSACIIYGHISCKQNLLILYHLIVLFTPFIIYASLGNLKTIYCWKSKMGSQPLGWVYVVTNKITISLNIFTNIIRSVDFRFTHFHAFLLHKRYYIFLQHSMSVETTNSRYNKPHRVEVCT